MLKSGNRVAATQVGDDLAIYERDWPAAWIQSDTVMEARP